MILDNKDGKYEWRPLELIHPALYVSLVDSITEPEHWSLIKEKFQEFSYNPSIKCLSIPVTPLDKEKDIAAQISHWWETIELHSIELSLDYEVTIHTDIVNCHGSIYTHTIAWALHTKKVAKGHRDPYKSIGNIIDNYIQNMRQGQTNGIPQGSVLMDFVVEMVLGYADTELAKRIAKCSIGDYQILRYVDDYRIFVNSPEDGRVILKCLTETMFDLGLKLNQQKTKDSVQIVQSSIKADKLTWLFRKQDDDDLGKRLMIIYDHSINHPNSGSLVRALLQFHNEITKREKYAFPMVLISIVVDIAYRNPRIYRFAVAIIGRLLDSIDTEADKEDIVKRIRSRFSSVPNTGHLDIWLQRMSYKIVPGVAFDEPLCKLLYDDDVQIWNNDWIRSTRLQQALKPHKIVVKDRLEKMSPTILPEELRLFDGYV